MNQANTTRPIAFSDDTLDNGLRVLTVKDTRVPIVNVQVWYHVGSKNEDPARQGFAHMFEHMMFRGTDRIGPQDHFKYLQRHGGRVNGYTSFDQTVYWETVPATQLDLALWLEAERMGGLQIDEAGFKAEREVVKEERRMRYLNRPYGKLYETLFSAVYQKHPYQWTPIGNMEHLDASTVDELRQFFRTWYVPNNATLVVVGDVTHEDVLAKARHYFGAIPPGNEPERVSIEEPPIDGPKRVEVLDRAPSPRVVMAYRGPSNRDPDAMAVNLLSRLMTQGQSSRMYRHLVQGKQVAVSVFAHDYALEQDGLFVMSATLKPDVSIDAGEQALIEEIRLLLEEGVQPEEVEKARNQAVAEYVREQRTVRGLADHLGYAAVVLGDVNRVNTDLDRLRDLEVEDVNRAAKMLFDGDRRVSIIIRPDEDLPPAEASTDQSEKPTGVLDLPQPDGMPHGDKPEPVKLPKAEKRTLSNGLDVVVFTDRSVPALNISLNMLVGAKHDPPDRTGLAYVTANLLRRGTTSRDGDALAELIDFHAMSLAQVVEHDDTGIRMWTLSDHRDLACEVLSEIVREPVFPEDEVKGFVERAAAREAINEENPSTTATRAFNKLLFGSYYLARPAGGTSDSLKAITRKDVIGYHATHYAPSESCLVFAGDIDADQAYALAEKHFGGWTAKVETRALEAAPEMTPQKILLIDRDEAVQSELRLGQLIAMSRQDPAYPVTRVTSHAFGESFSGRLNRSLRIDKGLTYGAFGYVDVERETASFRISTFTRTDRTLQAIHAALAEVERLRDEGLTRAELEASSDAIVGRFLLSLETPAQVADAWWNLKVWDLPEDWYADYLAAVEALEDPQCTAETARSLLDPSRLAIVVVGDADALEGELANLGQVERRSMDTLED